jgi:hypothetical protein
MWGLVSLLNVNGVGISKKIGGSNVGVGKLSTELSLKIECGGSYL